MVSEDLSLVRSRMAAGKVTDSESGRYLTDWNVKLQKCGEKGDFLKRIDSQLVLKNALEKN